MDRVLKVFAGLGLLFILLCVGLSVGTIGWLFAHTYSEKRAPTEACEVSEKDGDENIVVRNGNKDIVIPPPVAIPAYKIQKEAPAPVQTTPEEEASETTDAADDGFKVIRHADVTSAKDDEFQVIRRKNR